MNLKYILALMLALLNINCHAQNVALSFDDGFNPERQPKASEWNKAILQTLSDNSIQTIYYVAGHKVNSVEGLKLIADWGEKGHLIANHSFSHFNLASSKTSLQDYIADAKKNHQLLSDFKGWVNRFRFPYLKEGNSETKRDGFRLWMKESNYLSGAVSIDSSDWYYNQYFLRLLRNNSKQGMANLKKAYLDHLWQRSLYYDGLSKKLLNRSVDHVLLLHANGINAAFLDSIIKMYQRKGWNIISPEKAYQDPFYQQQPRVLPAGESLLWSLAKQQAMPGLRYPAEDSVYEKDNLNAIKL